MCDEYTQFFTDGTFPNFSDFTTPNYGFRKLIGNLSSFSKKSYLKPIIALIHWTILVILVVLTFSKLMMAAILTDATSSTVIFHKKQYKYYVYFLNILLKLWTTGNLMTALLDVMITRQISSPKTVTPLIYNKKL